MSKVQVKAVIDLMNELSSDAIEPALRVGAYERKLKGQSSVLVKIPRGDTIHERSGIACIRVGSAKRRRSGDERLRLAPRRAQSLICGLTSRLCLALHLKP